MTRPLATTADAERAGGPDLHPVPNDPLDLCDWLQHRYLPTPRDDEFLAALTAVLRVDGEGHPIPVPLRIGIVGEARGPVVLGASGAGKSVLIRRNLGRLPGPRRPSGLPESVLAVIVPADATLKSLARLMLDLTSYRAREGMTKSQLWDLVRHRLRTCDVGLVWIDEAHHLLVRRPGGDAAAHVLRELKSLMQGEGAVAVILSGVPSLDDDLRSDPETSRRIDRLRLHAWTAGAIAPTWTATSAPTATGHG